MDLGKRVEKRRVQLGMTQAQLGLIAGLAQNSIHNIIPKPVGGCFSPAKMIKT